MADDRHDDVGGHVVGALMGQGPHRRRRSCPSPLETCETAGPPRNWGTGTWRRAAGPSTSWVRGRSSRSPFFVFRRQPNLRAIVWIDKALYDTLVWIGYLQSPTAADRCTCASSAPCRMTLAPGACTMASCCRRTGLWRRRSAWQQHRAMGVRPALPLPLERRRPPALLGPAAHRGAGRRCSARRSSSGRGAASGPPAGRPRALPLRAQPGRAGPRADRDHRPRRSRSSSSCRSSPSSAVTERVTRGARRASPASPPAPPSRPSSRPLAAAADPGPARVVVARSRAARASRSRPAAARVTRRGARSSPCWRWCSRPSARCRLGRGVGRLRLPAAAAPRSRGGGGLRLVARRAGGRRRAAAAARSRASRPPAGGVSSTASYRPSRTPSRGPPSCSARSRARAGGTTSRSRSS